MTAGSKLRTLASASRLGRPNSRLGESPGATGLIKVLVVDDSSFMRKTLTYILESDESIKVAGNAVDGIDAIRKTKELKPDVILLDIMMPGMNGLEALEYIMSENPVPVLVLSGASRKDPSVVVKAFERGAIDYIEKPSGPISYDISKISYEIIYKIKLAAKAHVSFPAVKIMKTPVSLPEGLKEKIVVIGASTGGPKALTVVISGLPGNLPAPVLVVQHMGEEFISTFAERLKWGSPMNVSVAHKSEALKAGHVLVAPGGSHTVISVKGREKIINFSRKPSPHAILPSIDVAMESVAKVYREDAVGVLLTGAGEDGAEGMKSIKNAGGATIAEDESTAVIFGMPKAAIATGCVDEVVPLPKIAETIVRKLKG